MAGGGLDLLPNRGPVGIFAQPRGRGEHEIFEFAEHYYHIVMLIVTAVKLI